MSDSSQPQNLPEFPQVFHLDQKKPKINLPNSLSKVRIMFGIIGFLVMAVGIGLAVNLAQQQQTAQSRASDQSSAGVAQVDERFGISGDCQIAKALGIKWYSNWGHGAYANKGEIDCIEQGLNAFFTVGKTDNNENYLRADKNNFEYYIDVSTDFPEEYKTKYLKDEGDRNQYDQLKVYFKNWFNNSNHPERKNEPVIRKDNALDSFLRIPEYASKYPGLVYAVANEPDHGPYHTPKEYAQLYHRYFTRIKKYDPTAKVMVKGITTVTMNQNNNWARQFREEYKNLYGNYPHIDIWAIHPYAGNGGGDGQETIDYIVDFRERFLMGIGEPDAELWITEFGPTGDNSLSPDKAVEWDRNIARDYIPNVMKFLKETNYAQKWFWYYGSNRYHGGWNTELGDIWCTGTAPDYCANRTLNLKGEAYKTYAHQAPFTSIRGGSPGGGLIQRIIQSFGQLGNQENGDQNNDGKINELDFGFVYSR